MQSNLSGVHGVVTLRARVGVGLEQHHVDERDEDRGRAETGTLHKRWYKKKGNNIQVQYGRRVVTALKLNVIFFKWLFTQEKISKVRKTVEPSVLALVHICLPRYVHAIYSQHQGGHESNHERGERKARNEVKKLHLPIFYKKQN